MSYPLLFASCALNLEALLKEELRALQITDVRIGYRGVYAPYTMENVFKINYLSRIATRVLLPLTQFVCPDTETLYNEVKKLPWLDYLNETQTLSIDANINHPQIRHSLYGAQLVKDAVCDAIREKRGARPSVDTKNPDVQLNIFIQNKRASLSFDTSGPPLYKRGWKEQSGEASLPETLAAAILAHARYKKTEILCDPFCGSGTFLIEAASLATHTPAGYFRQKWGFTRLPSFKEADWLAFKAFHDAQRVALEEPLIIGADSDRNMITLCKEHLAKTGFEKGVLLVHSPIARFHPSLTPTLVVSNPPFGKRLEAPIHLYKEFGEFLHKDCPATPWAYLLTSSHHLAKATGCPILSEWPLQHGGLNVALYQLQNARLPEKTPQKGMPPTLC